MKRSNKKGFTIVELVIVIAIIAILAAVLIPTFASLIQKANESNDIQAAKNMNTFLAAANVTGDVKSILDVYDVFEDSGFAVENYTPLYKNRYYFYDKEYNQILYVDGDNDTVLYPTEHKGEKYSTLKHNWMSLSMSAPTGKEPSGFVKPEGDSKTMKATVKNAAEYAFVIDAYNRADAGVSLELTIDGEIDMKGASTVIKEAKGNIVIQKATGASTAVIKNVTSNYAGDSANNASGTESKYWTSALIAQTNHDVTIQGIKFENLNVKNVYAGNASLLVGSIGSNSQFNVSSVEIKDSTLIGHRSVGAVGGQIDATVTINGLTLTNTSVQTVGGRSAMILGAVQCDYSVTITDFDNVNSTFGIYENKDSEQEFFDKADGLTFTYGGADKFADDDTGVKYIRSIKNKAKPEDKVVYGYKEGALVFVFDVHNSNGTYNPRQPAKAYTAENFTNGGLSISKSGS